MSEKKFVKDLTLDEQTEILNFILNKFTLDDKNDAMKFYKVLVEYIKNVRRNVETFERNVDEIIDLFSKVGYENNDIIKMLSKEPSLLHADKNDIFWRLLILGKVYDSKTNSSARDLALIENPRILRTSQDVMYARIKYLESSAVSYYLRHSDNLSIRRISKVTHEEFEKSYGVNKEWLLKNYPFDNEAQLDIISWEENKNILKSIYGKSV